MKETLLGAFTTSVCKPIEAMKIADAQSWNVEGEIVDLNGNTTNCAWDNDEGGCE